MLECPICHKSGISTWRKLWMGPLWPARCEQCGKKVGVTHSSIIAVIPLAVAVGVGPFIPDFLLRWIVLLVGIILMFVIHIKYVQLVAK